MGATLGHEVRPRKHMKNKGLPHLHYLPHLFCALLLRMRRGGILRGCAILPKKVAEVAEVRPAVRSAQSDEISEIPPIFPAPLCNLRLNKS